MLGKSTAIATLAIALAAIAQCAAHSRRLICYYTNWSEFRTDEYSYRIEDIPGHLCTHVAYAFVGVDNTTAKLTSLKPEYDEQQNGFERFRDLKQRFPHLKLIVSVGGWTHGGEPFSRMASTRTRRRKFVASVVAFMKRYDLDGCELVWLWPGARERQGKREDKDNLYALVDALRYEFQLSGYGWEVSVQVPVDRARISVGYKQDSLCRAANFIHLAGYDLRGPWTGFADVHSVLKRRPHDKDYFYAFNVEDGVESWLRKGCNASQIVVGLPMYGRSYTLQNTVETALGSKTTGPGIMGAVTNDPGLLAYFEICELLKDGNWTSGWDWMAQSPYAHRGNQWIGYEDEQSLEKKLQWVVNNRLGGIYAYTLDMDDYVGKCSDGGDLHPLLRSLYKYVQNNATIEADIDFAIFRSEEKMT